MYEKLKKIFILIFIFLLQSCSGGKIGNFLESSFKNIDNSESDNKENYILKNEENRSEKQTLIKKIKKVNNQKSKLVESIEYQKKEDLKNDEKLINQNLNKEENSQQKIKKSLKPSNKKKILRPESYRITVILNEVDPSSPLKQFSNVLINSDLNFEIENIQRYPLNQNLNKNRE
tara:strand:- start:570 stop:1094 length:525 start_codon:yes stop_codon:yes gene_type:complete